MARTAGIGVAAGVSTSAALASLLVPSVAAHSLDGSIQRAQLRPLHLRFLLSANCCLSRQRMSKLQSFIAPSGLYSPSDSPGYLNSALSRTSGPLQVGLSFSQGLARPEINLQVCGAARGMAAGSGSDLESWIKKTNSSEPVVVYSKTYCPYCMRVKKLISSLGYDFEVIELDAGGQPGLQDALERVSGQYTVPNVFIGGKHIGGCDDTVALHSKGQLEPLLQAAGANRS